ncbi:septum site-determining protein MinC [Lactobacillaceae bacterium Scapto_B20]
MKAVSLKGTQNGYEIVLEPSSSLSVILPELEKLLAKLSHDYPNKQMQLEIITGQRLLTQQQQDEIRHLFDKYEQLLISKIDSDVITIEEANRIKEAENIHIIVQTVRNGQILETQGDVLFLGTIHQGGKLVTNGNIYVLGSVYGILQAGMPASEDNFIVGDLHNAQQIRIGEQFDIIADRDIDTSYKTMAYINNLHTLDYGKIKELKQINPKFYNRIGGVL